VADYIHIFHLSFVCILNIGWGGLIWDFLFQCTCKILQFCIFILYAFCGFFKLQNSQIVASLPNRILSVHMLWFIRQTHVHACTLTQRIAHYNVLHLVLFHYSVLASCSLSLSLSLSIYIYIYIYNFVQKCYLVELFFVCLHLCLPSPLGLKWLPSILGWH
jgi:hypothetical protein